MQAGTRIRAERALVLAGGDAHETPEPTRAVSLIREASNEAGVAQTVTGANEPHHEPDPRLALVSVGTHAGRSFEGPQEDEGWNIRRGGELLEAQLIVHMLVEHLSSHSHSHGLLAGYKRCNRLADVTTQKLARKGNASLVSE